MSSFTFAAHKRQVSMTNRQLFLRHVAQTSDAPLSLEIERAEGIYLFDAAGNAYMDLISGVSVSNLGHRHPAVEKAVREQLGKYWHTFVYGEYVLSPQVQLAKLLCENLPSNLDSVFFVNSGSEAVEGAMKLAKRYTGRPEIIACRQSYHGSTQGAASLMSPTIYTQPYHPLLPGIRHIDFGTDADLQHITHQTAAVVIEVIQAEAGIKIAGKDYFLNLRKRCDETGTLLILDEIQTGFGRTGTLFAFEQYSFEPDILLLAKGMGGGMPLGCFIAPTSIMQVLSHHPPLGHITTFGGHPVSCAASLATLETLLESNYSAAVIQKTALFRQLLQHPTIREIRSAGLMMAIDVGAFDLVLSVVRICLEKGLVVDWFLFNSESIRIAPPLIITEEEIRKACSLLLEALDEAIS